MVIANELMSNKYKVVIFQPNMEAMTIEVEKDAAEKGLVDVEE